MKAAVNGVLNLSVLDGWWPEAYNAKNGWAITGAGYHSEPEMQEAAEAAQIYDLIEESITDLYYDRDEAGVPVRWADMMKESIYSVGCRFNMGRVFAEYIDKLYMPAGSALDTLTHEDYASLAARPANITGSTEILGKIAIGNCPRAWTQRTSSVRASESASRATCN